MEINEIQKVRPTLNPKSKIKSIRIENGNSAQIIEMIAKALNFKIHNDRNGISAYGGRSIRISDHRTYMQTWVDSHTWNSPIRLDIVIEDNETQGTTDVKNGYSFNIDEFIYKSSVLDSQSIRLIAFDILNVLNGQSYANNARGEHKILTSTFVTPKDNNQLNCNNIMSINKKTVRLTDAKLKNIISEVIKSVLKEGKLDFSEYPRLKRAYSVLESAIFAFEDAIGYSDTDLVENEDMKELLDHLYCAKTIMQSKFMTNIPSVEDTMYGD